MVGIPLCSLRVYKLCLLNTRQSKIRIHVLVSFWIVGAMERASHIKDHKTIKPWEARSAAPILITSN
jgi:hypothetical protein